MDRKNQFAIIEAAETAILKWSETKGINLYRVEFVVPFVEDSFDLGVWIFYQTDQEVTLYAEDGTSHRVEQQFLNELQALDYPKQFITQVKFRFDSDKNVQRNFEGSYFYRLR